MVERNFERALEMLMQMAQEQGLELEALAEEAPLDDVDPLDHPLFQRAEAYREKVWKFLPRLREAIKAESAALLERAEIMPSLDEEAETLTEMVDAYEVISWYHVQVTAKIYRALSGKQESEEEEDADLKTFAMEDAHGSAKVAYEGLLRCMAALQKVYALDADLLDDVLSLLLEAERLRKGIDAELPGHREFKRPGFDD